MKFSIYSKGTLVGYSNLEHGDPPMGVAHGAFVPEDGYALIRDECAANHADQSALELSARTTTGAVIECVGVGILDYSAEAGESFAEVNVLGIPYPLYGELFPSHVRAYCNRPVATYRPTQHRNHRGRLTTQAP